MSSPRITTGSSGDRILWVAASAVGLAAAAAILGGAMGDRVGDLWHWLHWIAKPLTTLMILGVALLARSAVSLRYRRWIVAGMACSLMGDILLMLPGDLFVAGLVAFLGGHVCFIKAFLSDRRVAVVPLAWLACLLVGAVNLWLLWPSIPNNLHLTVTAYGAVLSVMAGQAIGRAWIHAASADPLALPARRAAVGAVLFMLSDSLLAWNRFDGALRWSTLCVLGSYYAALWCLARSVAWVEPPMASGALT